ncbi:MAG: 50S ribosomal protein L18 [Spirochaetia bacterium]|nr:50S ribosomal protein L18 [Spirochaetia bacterium]MCF7953243.1 50S ribosomal protein L18 [Spirochaetales bacterium]
MKKVTEKLARRKRRKFHIRKTISGTPECPRMSVFKSSKHLYVQVIDDTAGKTIISASNLEKELRDIPTNVEGAAKLGEIAAKRLIEKKIETVKFDRNGNLYHGVIKSLADGARKTGIKF